MKDDAAVFVIVPAYNEAAVIEATLQPLLELPYHVVVVDDGSEDGTWDVLAGLAGVHALRHPINLGMGAALQTGMTYALQQGAGALVHFDADGQHRADEIEMMVEPLRTGEADIVLGSRFLREGDQQNVPPARRLLLRAATLVEGVLSGLWLSDAHNGFRALSREAAEQLHLQENGFAHASEVLYKVRALNLRYVERPTQITYSDYSREKGQSGLNAVNILLDRLISRVMQ